MSVKEVNSLRDRGTGSSDQGWHLPRTPVLLCLLAILLFLSGCIETKVEVRLRSDGSGSRRVEMAWKQGDLDDLELTVDELRVLLELPAERGWTMGQENRPVGDGSLEPHVVFERVAEIDALEEWQREGQDLRVRVDRERPARLHDEILVEVGQGSGYRTLSYVERLDGHEIRALLDRMAARFLAEKIASSWPQLDETAKAELRGLLSGHLSHYHVWALDDDDSDDAWQDLVADFSPQLGHILMEYGITPQHVQETHGRVHEIFHDDELDAWLEGELPGVSLLALMNVKFEIGLPGVIVESNADRVGDGYAAWERPAWNAIEEPLEFRVRSHIEP